MSEKVFHATRVRQGDLCFYATSLTVKDVLEDGFYNVRTLDAGDKEGYQRILDKSRAKKISDYVVENIDDPKGVFIPTSIFLTTEKSIPFSDKEQTITIDSDVLPFNVVDGQHRLEGFRMAVDKKDRVLDYEIAVNICPGMPHLHQMCHFYIVNTTQKKVDESVGQHIISRLTRAYTVSDMPNLPKWMDRLVRRGDIDRALHITEYLNNTQNSPWFEKIVMANKPKKGGTVNQKTFVKSVQQHVMSPSNPILFIFKDDPEKLCKALVNYWRGIIDCIEPEDSSVLFKYTGAAIFNKFSSPFFQKLHNYGDYTKDAVDKTFQHIAANLDGEYAGLMHREWWQPRGPASRMNHAAHPEIIAALSAALNARDGSARIKI